jgi:pimeloyl-ACP methyl ester carboxylesterase
MDTPSWIPEPSSGIEIRTVMANGQQFEVAMAGQGPHLALCLHGFPEFNYSWRAQIPLLVRLGYRVWAPNLRGYGQSSRPRGGLGFRDPTSASTGAIGGDECTTPGHIRARAENLESASTQLVHLLFPIAVVA